MQNLKIQEGKVFKYKKTNNFIKLISIINNDKVLVKIFGSFTAGSSREQEMSFDNFLTAIS